MGQVWLFLSRYWILGFLVIILASWLANMKISTLFFGGIVPLASSSSNPKPCSLETFQNALSSPGVVASAVQVANGGSYGEGSANVAYPIPARQLPALCAVIVNVSTSATSNYRFGLFLPAKWNSRFVAIGNGGFLGGINWLDMGDGVRYGHAVVSTDTGHNSSNNDFNWALHNQERKKDFGYRAMHGSVQLGKELVNAYYGTNITYSYYSGASTGGRQGLKEAQISPDSFDGLIIGAPAWYTSHMQPWTTKVATYNLPVSDKKHVRPSLFATIGDEVIRQCDQLDGVKDGIVSHPDLCDFTLTSLMCDSAGAKPAACLTAEQAETVKNFYRDYYAEGRLAFPGLELGSESQWSFLLSGPAPTSFGDAYIQYFLLDDPSWHWSQFNDSIVWQADAADPGNCTADNYNMTAFERKGGKILLYHGMADALIPQRSSDLLYERVANAMGGVEALQSWFRFFLIPGMQHVTGTAVGAPWYFAGAGSHSRLGEGTYSTPGFEDARHDALLALMAWVENGTAIDQLVVTSWKTESKPSSGVKRQRPLCPFPKRQTYDGKGDPDRAESFFCR